MKVSPGFLASANPCPNTKKYLEVTYRCEEKKEGVSSRLATGPYPGTTAGLAVSSDNEIFVTHSSIKTIQVFSMKGVKLRNIPTGDMKPCGIATGLNNSLWVVLQGGHENRPMYENAVSQYRKDGHVLAKYNCNGRFIIHGIAVDKLADKIILTIERRSGVRLHTEFVWFRPTHTQGMPTCNMTKFGSIEGDARHSVAVDKRGNIFMPEWYNDRVLKYDKNGVYLSSFGSKGTGAGYLLGPYGICVDSWGRVIVADYGNHRLEMFTAKGDHVCTVAYIRSPCHVAISGEGQLVVSNEASITILPKH
ncbi:NHL repeat-containing protein 3-like [Branchiostoma floridae x Branchiostoma japonicum]